MINEFFFYHHLQDYRSQTFKNPDPEKEVAKKHY